MVAADSAAPGPGQASVRNLTPHPVTLITVDDRTVTLAQDGIPPRVVLHQLTEGTITTTRGVFRSSQTARTAEVTDLPDAESGVLLIVSRIVAESSPNRADLVFPDDLVRDSEGVIVGARSLGQIAPSGSA